MRIIRAAADIADDVDHAVLWHRSSPTAAFGDRTAEQLVAQGRTEDVLRYVASREAGWAD